MNQVNNNNDNKNIPMTRQRIPFIAPVRLCNSAPISQLLCDSPCNPLRCDRTLTRSSPGSDIHTSHPADHSKTPHLHSWSPTIPPTQRTWNSGLRGSVTLLLCVPELELVLMLYVFRGVRRSGRLVRRSRRQ